ncbi:P-loop containing nucleoside triphosphate hydrolase protein [Zychaea mexicana]|uniref:P-loop containing nucleoside triphosphate hydrolase protein n=1 Tax=Zychaea mexicana TaxID=64656 RepID=UPI0022FECE38|nr:P-loop containing nucleoside triphosphate hydrolase protein [Zychaea mexicana]KAI9488356.1 P-loop containing nucleoside triphosphate hydrolase protein [Zychaea mexicana]
MKSKLPTTTTTTSSPATTTTRHVPEAILPPYAYKQDTQLPELPIALKPSIEVRPYQREAVNAIIDPATNVAQSSIIVLPCGAGKTLTSILVACTLQKPVLVVCSTIIAAEQFSNEFLNFTTLMASKTGMFAGQKKWPFNGPSGVMFTTYTMLVDSKNRTADSKRMSKFINATEWGLVILDEVHCVPASNFSKAIAKINTKVRLGLTATMLREDEKIGDLETLVGPTLYHAKWKELADKGYIAKVICTQVELSMDEPFRQVYDDVVTDASGSSGVLGHAHHIKSLLSILNPKKIQICQRLIQYHEARGDKILVFCDHIDALKLYAEKLNRPFIYGGTSPEDARSLLKRFQIDIPKLNPKEASWSELAAQRALKAKSVNTLLLSRIGDTSLDLPAATVLIQVSSHFGSRRQEAQRLGRVLRAKKRSEKGFYSRFYTLVTRGTHETSFSERRRQFLEEDCGYGYQIWAVGDENSEDGGNGWHVDSTQDVNAPEDDGVKVDPVTCTIHGADDRPYTRAADQKVLADYIRNIKNVQVEEDTDDVADVTTPQPAASKRGNKKK